MAKNKKDKKPLSDVERYQVKIKLIGGLICLIALITAFVVGLFVGKAIGRGSTAKDTAVVDTVLTSDSVYTLSGTWVGNDSVNAYKLYQSVTGYGNFSFVCGGVTYSGFSTSRSSTSGGVGVGYTYYMRYVKLSDNTTVKVYESDSSGHYWSSDVYRTIEIVGTYTYSEDDLSFYNWFTSNYTQQVETYNVTYDLRNGVTVPSPINTISTDSLPVTVWLWSNFDDTGYSAEYMSISVTNCEYYISDVLTAYEVGIVITAVSGDVVITAENVHPELTRNSTVVKFIGSVYEYDYYLGQLENCQYYIDDVGDVYVIPLDETLNYSFTIFVEYTFDVISLSISSRTVGVQTGVPYDYDSGPAFNIKACDVVVSSDVVNSSILVNFYGMGGVEVDDDIISRSFVDWLVVAVGGFFSFSIMPGLSIGLILGTMLLCALVVWMLKMFAGG